MSPRRPILRWHGGKWILAPWIISHLPPHRVYCEPFGGAASVLLRKPRSYAEIYNDLDGEVVNLFRVARDQGSALRDALALTPFARDEFTQAYESTSNCLEQARRTVVRSFMGFGSNSHNKATGFRFNSNRSGTTPAHDWANYPDAFDALIERLRGVVIENRDAVDCMRSCDGIDTVHYVDPPYVQATRGNCVGYRHELTETQHSELAFALKQLNGKVVLSGYRCDMYDTLYANWHRIDRAAHADGARDRVESLWLSPNCERRQLEIAA